MARRQMPKAKHPKNANLYDVSKSTKDGKEKDAKEKDAKGKSTKDSKVNTLRAEAPKTIRKRCQEQEH